MDIHLLTDDKAPAWNAFVDAQAEATFFHRAEWQNVIEDAFGFQNFYMYAQNGGEIVGILPLSFVKRPLFGNAMISNPLCVYGGAVANNEEIRVALEEAAVKRARALRADYLELRNQKPCGADWPVSEEFYTFRGMISGDHEENLKAIPRKQRAEVRKGMDANLETSHNQDIDLFYKIYATSVRNLGTPVFPRRYLEALVKNFGNACEVTTVARNGEALSSVLSFYFRDQVLPYYGGGLPQARDYSAYPYMYWEVMKRATDKGCRVFDFGRSMVGTGAFAFKKNWGFEPEKLHYSYALLKAKAVPDMNPHTARNKFLTSVWSKFPLVLANRLGPVLYPVVV